MKPLKNFCTFGCLALAILLAAVEARGDAIFSGCSQSALIKAIATGGTVNYTQDCSLTLTNTIQITNSVIIDAAGHAASISGNNATRIFNIAPGVEVTLRGLTLTSGRATNNGGSAIFINSDATVTLVGCVLSANAVFGANGIPGNPGDDHTTKNGGDGGNGTAGTPGFGGAIFNQGTLAVYNCVFGTNTATGGIGGAGGDGGAGGGSFSFGGNGGTGAAGGAAAGAGIYNVGQLAVSNSAFSGNTVVGGTGGMGGVGGEADVAGRDAAGGAGGSGMGAGIYSEQPAAISSSTFSDNSSQGGNSASGGTDSNGDGTNGRNGASGLGGGICNFGFASVTNCTIFRNRVFGGSGGDGGIATGPLGFGGTGGNGGLGSGGGVYNLGNIVLVNCTLSTGGVTGGTNGVGGTGPVVGENGSRGAARGGNLANGGGSFQLLNTIIAAASPGTNAFGAFTDLGSNISSDKSIPFTGTSRKGLDPQLAALADNGGPTLTMAIPASSPARNAGAIDGAPNVDQRGVPRPNEGVPDIGAYETAGPIIVTQPHDVTVAPGKSATFSVVATGTTPLFYQWRFQAQNIPGATKASLTITNAQSTNQGLYGVFVSNPIGFVLSHSGLLTVGTAPSITNQTTNVITTVGSNALFSVSASSPLPLSYQWSFNGTNLAGATTNTLLLTNVQTNNAGTYSASVSNTIGTTTSSPMTLRVILPTGLTISGGASNALQLNLRGQSGLSYVVETKTNLTNTVWIPISTNTTATNGPLSLSLPQTNGPSGFFRLRIQ
jgi:hypothetical protein